MRRMIRQFDHIILLSAPAPVLIERLATRTTNPVTAAVPGACVTVVRLRATPETLCEVQR